MESDGATTTDSWLSLVQLWTKDYSYGLELIFLIPTKCVTFFTCFYNSQKQTIVMLITQQALFFWSVCNFVVFFPHKFFFNFRYFHEPPNHYSCNYHCNHCWLETVRRQFQERPFKWVYFFIPLWLCLLKTYKTYKCPTDLLRVCDVLCSVWGD